MGTKSKIMQRLTEGKPGQVVFLDTFADLGSPVSVRVALSTLVKEGRLLRLAQGIYLYPQIHPEFGVLHPSTKTLADAIAKRDGIKLMPGEVVAQNVLGLSTQVPAKAVYLTDGPSRKVKIGGREIWFRHTSPKYFQLQGKGTPWVFAALKRWHIREYAKLDKRRMYEALRLDSREVIIQDCRYLPAYARKFYMDFLKENDGISVQQDAATIS